MEFLEEPVWSCDSAWVQFTGHPQRLRIGVFRVSASTGGARQVFDLTPFGFGGDWIGIAPDGSPLRFVRPAHEIYALDWWMRLRRP
jgi:hypothetical protein